MRYPPATAVVLAALMTIVSGCGGDAAPLPYQLAPNLEQVFESEGVDGTVVIQEFGSDEPPLVYNVDRSRLGLPPAETFRPLATLILLEHGTMHSLDEERAWDHTGPYVQDWDRAHSLRTGASADAEWLYVQTVAETGLSPFEVWINRVEYGNRNVRGGSGSFWMDGTLLTTTLQQATFMEVVFSERHPFEHYAALDTKDTFLAEFGDGWTMRYVLGLVPGPRTADKIGWLVGVVDSDDGSWAVAMNTDLHWDQTIDPDKRLRLTTALLDEAGIIGG